MEHLDLFTRVEDALPEPKKRYLCIAESLIDGQVYKGIYETNPIGGFYVEFDDDGENPLEKVTHWLDLSKLTTKEKAEKAICTAYKMPNKPFDDYTIPELDNLYDSL